MNFPSPAVIARVAAGLGIVSADTLTAWLKDKRYTQADVARLCGTGPEHFANLLAQDEPLPVVITTQHEE